VRKRSAYDFANAGNGFQPGTLPEASPAFACHDVCHVISGLDTTLAGDAMADARTILPAMTGSNITRKALFKETAYCQALWITILEVAQNTARIFDSARPALQSGAR